MQEFERLIGAWHGEGDYNGDPPFHLAADATIERLGPFLVFRSDAAEPPELPSTVSIIGGAADGEPQPMAYFDSRGVHRLFDMTFAGGVWMLDRKAVGPKDFDQRMTATFSTDGNTITAQSELRDARTHEMRPDFSVIYRRS